MARDVLREIGHVSHAQVFYFGIIDFLQYYNVGKKAEHLFKSAVSNPLEIR